MTDAGHLHLPSSDPRWRPVERCVRVALVVLGLGFAAAFAWVSLSRRSYPFDLEWMEGGELLHSYELLHGRAIYRPPSADFIAYAYQPLYPALVALVGTVTGLDLALARTVSLVSTVIAAALVVKIVLSETRNAFVAAVACGMFFALYPVTGFWLDLARVDSLFFALLLGGLYLATGGERVPCAWLLSGVLMVLAFKTKQLALFFVPLPAAVFYARAPRTAVLYVAVTGLLLATDFGVEETWTHGWYSFYTERVPTGQPYIASRIGLEFWLTLLTTIPVVCVAVYAEAKVRLRGSGWREIASQTWLLATAVGAVTTLLAWARPGGAENNFLTFDVFAILVAAIALHRALSSAVGGRRVALLACVGLQYAMLAYDPRRQVPSAADRAAEAELVAMLAAVRGPVLIPDHPWSAVLAGKEPSFQTNALWEWQYTAHKESWPADLRERLGAGYYDVVVTAGEPAHAGGGLFPPELLQRYRRARTLNFGGNLGSLTGGYRGPPSLVFERSPQQD